MSRHQEIMNAAYVRWDINKWTPEEFLGHLNPLEKFAVCTGNFNYQVCNGGFSQWHGNGYGTKETAQYLIGILSSQNKENCTKAAGLLRRYLKLDFSHDEEYDDFDDFIYRRLSELDDEFYTFNELLLIELEESLQNFSPESKILPNSLRK